MPVLPQIAGPCKGVCKSRLINLYLNYERPGHFEIGCASRHAWSRGFRSRNPFAKAWQKAGYASNRPGVRERGWLGAPGFVLCDVCHGATVELVRRFGGNRVGRSWKRLAGSWTSWEVAGFCALVAGAVILRNGSSHWHLRLAPMLQ